MDPALSGWLSMVVAALAGYGVGVLWYSPALFGRAWMAASGLTKERLAEQKAKGMGKTYAISLVAALVTAYVLAVFIRVVVVADSAFEGMQTAFWVWLGFVAPVMLSSVLWEGRPWRFFLINASHQLVALLVMGAILAVWQ